MKSGAGSYKNPREINPEELKPGVFLKFGDIWLSEAHARGFYLCGTCAKTSAYQGHVTETLFRILDGADKTELAMCKLAGHTLYKPTDKVPFWECLRD